MFQIDVLQNQWLILALLGGFAAVLLVTLMYIAIWQRRSAHQEQHVKPDEQTAQARGARKKVPWILIVVYIVMLAYLIVYTINVMLNPPNW